MHNIKRELLPEYPNIQGELGLFVILVQKEKTSNYSILKNILRSEEERSK